METNLESIQRHKFYGLKEIQLIKLFLFNKSHQRFMKYLFTYFSLFIFLLFSHEFYAQNNVETPTLKPPAELFRTDQTLPIKLSFSIKELKKLTNDSTYINTSLGYLDQDGSQNDIQVELRVRGYFRLKNCYFPPLKVKIKKSESKGTLFEGNKELKLVIQCSDKKGTNDYIIKEYLAYRLYELISTYHYDTRLVKVSLVETKGSQEKNFELMGFFIEDTKKVAKRNGGDVMKRNVHPMAQDPMESVHNAFFQYMIGNTDFSTYARHNEKLLFVDKKIVPLPYDFDMSGLVNANYASISAAGDNPLPISSVRERYYRGFKRDPKIIAQVRQEFINKKFQVIEVIDSLEPLFENPKEFSYAKTYLMDFYKVMENDGLYKNEITNRLRTN